MFIPLCNFLVSAIDLQKLDTIIDAILYGVLKPISRIFAVPLYFIYSRYRNYCVLEIPLKLALSSNFVVIENFGA